MLFEWKPNEITLNVQTFYQCTWTQYHAQLPAVIPDYWALTLVARVAVAWLGTDLTYAVYCLHMSSVKAPSLTILRSQGPNFKIYPIFLQDTISLLM
jgi:hypothetical protein